MGKYSCEKCAKSFSQKSHYDKHLTRKNPCEIQTDKIKALIDKAVEEKLIELNKKLISNNTENNITINITEQMDISTMSKLELLEKCKELGITKCSSKNKSQLIELIHSKQLTPDISNIWVEPPVKNNEIIIPISELPVSDCKIINYIDLCCGIGGFRVALESFQKKNTNIKFNCVLSDTHDLSYQQYDGQYNRGVNFYGLPIEGVTPTTMVRDIVDVDKPALVNIPQMRIDDLNLSSCDLIHLDVEGSEDRVLKGAINTLQKFKPVIILESLNAEGYELIYSLGYGKIFATIGDTVFVAT